MSEHSRIWALHAAATLAALAPTASAEAQQPLRSFLSAAAEHADAIRSARASESVEGSRVDERRARLLPSLRFEAGYTRNEVPVVAMFPDGMGGTQTATITAQDQVDGRLTLDVPLVDVPAWSRFLGAESSADAARARRVATELDVNRSVVTEWFRLAGARALIEAGEQARTTARDQAVAVARRADAGVDAELDRLRAEAEVAQAERTIADAELDEALAARALEALTGVTPSRAGAALDDSLAEEPPLEPWLRRADAHPSAEAAELDRRAAEREREAAWQALLPTLSASAAERYTNAAGFGPSFLWSLGLSLSWSLDVAGPAGIATAERAVERASADADRARTEAETAIHRAYFEVRASLARARAARAAEALYERALTAAQSGFDAGVRSPLELSQAHRDLANARAERIRAFADLGRARLALRLEAGLPPSLEATP
ncbi:MAG: TolC family protein [Sandaracinaceae bacterium]